LQTSFSAVAAAAILQNTHRDHRKWNCWCVQQTKHIINQRVVDSHAERWTDLLGYSRMAFFVRKWCCWCAIINQNIRQSFQRLWWLVTVGYNLFSKCLNTNSHSKLHSLLLYPFCGT